MSLQKGLVGHWTMDSQDVDNGVLRDRSAYDNYAGINGSVAIGSNSIIGESIDFSGSSGYLRLGQGHPLDFQGDDFSLSFYLYVKSAEDRDGIINVTLEDDSVFAFNIEEDISGSPFILKFRSRDDSNNNQSIGSTGDLALDTWFHFALVRKGDNIKLYKDGTVEFNNSYSHTIHPAGDAHFGAQPDYSRDLQGKLSSIRVYDRALSDSEINSLYQQRSLRLLRSSIYNNLIARWKLTSDTYDNGTFRDSSAYDTHGDERNGLIVSDEYTSFDASDSDYISMGVLDKPYDLGETGSISVFFRTSETGISNLLLSNDTRYANDNGYAAYASTDFLRLYIEDSGNDDFLDYNIDPVLSSDWHHYVGTWNIDNMDLYLDKELVASMPRTTGTDLETNNVFDIGRGDYDKQSHFTGDISDVRLYNKKLDQSEINRIFNKEITRLKL